MRWQGGSPSLTISRLTWKAKHPEAVFLGIVPQRIQEDPSQTSCRRLNCLSFVKGLNLASVRLTRVVGGSLGVMWVGANGYKGRGDESFVFSGLIDIMCREPLQRNSCFIQEKYFCYSRTTISGPSGPPKEYLTAGVSDHRSIKDCWRRCLNVTIEQVIVCCGP